MNIYLTFNNDFNSFITISNYYYLKERNPNYNVYIYESESFSNEFKKLIKENNTIIKKSNRNLKFKVFQKNILISRNIEFKNDIFYAINNKSTLFNSYLVNGVINKKYIYKPNIVLNLNNILLCSLKMDLIKNTNFILNKEIINKNIYFIALDTIYNSYDNVFEYKNNNDEMCLLTKLKEACEKTIINNNYNISKNKLLLNKIKNDKNHFLITNLNSFKVNDNELNYKESNNSLTISLVNFYANKFLGSNANVFINKYTEKVDYFKTLNYYYKNENLKEIDMLFNENINLFLDYDYLNNKIKEKLKKQIKLKYNINIHYKENKEESTLILTINKDINKDTEFSEIKLFNKLIKTIPYLLSLEFYFNIDLSINDSIHYPIKNLWQSPAITEYMSYLQIRFSDKIKNYVAFPWAVLFDNHIVKKQNTNVNLPFIDLYTKILKKNIFKDGVTVIQIIDWRDYLPVFKLLGIKKVFASHCSKPEKYNDIEIYPFFLYSYTYDYYNNNNNLISNMIISVSTNKDREKLCDKLNLSKNINIKKNNDWFFKKFVYHYQLFHKFIKTSDIKLLLKNHNDYMNYIKDSSFQLCLRGRGDNTIRIFESLKLGIVPVIDFDLKIESINFDLNNYVIKLNFNDLINYININNDISNFEVNNINFLEKVKELKIKIRNDYKLIRINLLYNNYIEDFIF